MKKLSQISDKIKDDSFSYTGKGSFESIFLKNKNQIIEWLEELTPLQKQIEFLYELEKVEFQKRNYTRILTKYLSKEYVEFVSINILLRDLNAIKTIYSYDENIVDIYNKLILNKYLKYPGKSDKYVEFKVFEEFTVIYKDELNLKQTTIKTTQIEENTQNITKKENSKEKINWTNLLLGK